MQEEICCYLSRYNVALLYYTGEAFAFDRSGRRLYAPVSADIRVVLQVLRNLFN
ncbi:MAG: hypothetical protein LBS19_13905 [Clostridiales bacterium]|jgi:hypothetical protein|nr:hypothetical protein [Clostridiales bacterium]